MAHHHQHQNNVDKTVIFFGLNLESCFGSFPVFLACFYLHVTFLFYNKTHNFNKNKLFIAGRLKRHELMTESEAQECCVIRWRNRVFLKKSYSNQVWFPNSVTIVTETLTLICLSSNYLIFSLFHRLN